MTQSGELRTRRPRVLGVAVAMALGVFGAGFLMASQSWPGAPSGSGVAAVPSDGGAWHLERSRATTRSMRNDLEVLVAGRSKRSKAEPASNEREAAIKARAERRAYDGAPPTIPHEIDQMSTEDCFDCHESGEEVDDVIAPIMPHAYYTNCTQCHISTAPREGVAVPEVENGFRGVMSSGPGDRAWKGAPPTVPHAIDMRIHCLACHGPKGKPGLRTPHPDRPNCVQCHIPTQHWAQWMD